MRKLFAAPLQVLSVLGLDRILDGRRHWVVNTQDAALDKLDFSCRVSLDLGLVLSRSPSLSRVASNVGIRSRRGTALRESACIWVWSVVVGGSWAFRLADV